MQMMCRTLGGEVQSCERGEYGVVTANLDGGSVLFKDIRAQSPVLMSHGDHVSRLPDGFAIRGKLRTAIMPPAKTAKASSMVCNFTRSQRILIAVEELSKVFYTIFAARQAITNWMIT